MIKSNLFKPKNIRRMTVFLALLAPLVYLFGSQFAALNGAHGEEVLADDNAMVATDYDELMTPENFSYGAFDWENEHGNRLGYSLGCYKLTVLQDTETYFSGTYFGVWSYGMAYDSDCNFGLGFSGAYESNYDEYITLLVTSDHLYRDDYTMPDRDFYFPFYFVSNTNVYMVFSGFMTVDGIEIFLWDDDAWNIVDSDDFVIDDTTEYFVYFDDGRNLPEGVEWNDELRSYFVPTVKATQPASYSSTLFGSMFGHDNFLIDIGRNALSDDPKGFAPFGSFWSYLDSNVLHLGDSDIGLMGYGYMYYAAHVLLFDIGFMLLTFFLSFIQKIGDRFAGGD